MTTLYPQSTPTESPAAEQFELPPRVHTSRGAVRKVGFELEFAGLSILQAALTVHDLFGGTHKIHGTFEQTIESPIGKFSCEIDSSLLKDKRYEQPLRALGFKPDTMDLRWLENALLGALSTVVPIEIGAPPIPMTELAPLDELRERLRQRGAKGTRASLVYAFGMHINPEIASDEPQELLDVLRAFLLLFGAIRDEAEVDLARRVSPFINPFPDEYVRLVLSSEYRATRENLIDDYVRFNPTRNRALDLLPVLAHLDEGRVLDRVKDRHLVKPRPAYHYRLPNCMIDEPQWTLAGEWNRWVAVERLAADRGQLAERARLFLETM